MGYGSFLACRGGVASRPAGAAGSGGKGARKQLLVESSPSRKEGILWGSGAPRPCLGKGSSPALDV